MVEHVIGNDEVVGSIPTEGSKPDRGTRKGFATGATRHTFGSNRKESMMSLLVPAVGEPRERSYLAAMHVEV